MFAEVAFPIRSFQTFTYSVPKEHASKIHVGSRVYVPFRNKIIQGVVVNIKNTNSFQGPIKKITRLVDNVNIITPSLWKLIKWVSNYYMTPIGKVANSVVPKSLSTNYKTQLEKYVEARKGINLKKLNDLKKIAPKQFLVSVSQSAADPGTNPNDFGSDATSRRGMMHINTSTGDIFIWS